MYIFHCNNNCHNSTSKYKPIGMSEKKETNILQHRDLDQNNFLTKLFLDPFG